MYMMRRAALILSVICSDGLEADGLSALHPLSEDFKEFSTEILSILRRLNGTGASALLQPPPRRIRRSPSDDKDPRNFSQVVSTKVLRGSRGAQPTSAPSSIDRIAAELTGNSVPQAAIGKAAYAGLSDLITLLQAGAPASELVQHTTVTVGTILATGVAAVYPIAGMAITIFTSFVSGLIGQLWGGSSDPTQALYEAIIAEVQLMINRNNLATKLQTVQNRLLAISDELAWVPDVLEETPEATQIAWMLTVQHSLELSWRDVFGDCVANGASPSCREWQEAGTVDVALKFSAMHIALLVNMATWDSSTVRMASLLQSRIGVIGARYHPLVENSYDVYRAAKLAGIEVTTRIYGRASGTPPCWEEVTLELYDVQCVDAVSSNPIVFTVTGCKDYRRPILQSSLDDAAAACSAHRAAVTAQLDDTQEQMDTLFLPFKPVTCPAEGWEYGLPNMCYVLEEKCWNTYSSWQHHNGCAAWARGWEKKDVNCPGCSPTTRVFGCCDLSECEAFCDDIYPNDPSRATGCKEGCSLMQANSEPGNGLYSRCCQTTVV